MAKKRFTYSGDPSKSKKDEVRFLIGDTTKDRALFDDREILFQIGKTPNTRMAGSELLLVKATEFSQLADIRVGDVSKSFSQVSKSMKACAKRLRDQALSRALPFFGGRTVSGRRALAEQTDDVQPNFFIGQNDDPSVVQLNSHIGHLLRLDGNVV